jgi:23S rRNA (cytosine1962-C5)-methyltransferase
MTADATGGTARARRGTTRARARPSRPSVIVRPGGDARLRAGHLWVYRTEIARVEGDPQDGEAVSVRSASGRYLGTGWLNMRSAIAVRLLTPEDRDIDDAFLADRLRRALALRGGVATSAGASRLVYSEGDYLPGLIVDRYADLLVVQTLTLAMDRRKHLLVRLLSEMVHPRGIYARNDPAVRRLEGLPREHGWLAGGGPTEIEIEEGESRFLVDVAQGQKTGFFLDQRENRASVASLARGAHVLDCFAYTGAWGIRAARHGAASVVGVESSDAAAALAGRNAALNGCADRCQWLCENAFDALRRLAAAGPGFDLAILDPPAFVKTRSALAQGLGGYKEINLRALKALRPNGWLITCSCSYHVDEPTLTSVVWDASRDARRTIRIVESRSQARDHPVHPAMPETRYLKCLVIAVE